MNRILVLIGIAVIAISKGIVLKSILVDSSVYHKCVSEAASSLTYSCGTDPFTYFILGWFVTVGGFVLLIFGLKMPSTTTTISR
jgi:hypothetical protein